MPPAKGPRFGEKGFGGRKKGAKNKRTVERELILSRIAASQQPDAKPLKDRPLAKENLDEFQLVWKGLAAKWQGVMTRAEAALEAAIERNAADKQIPLLQRAFDYAFKKFAECSDRSTAYSSMLIGYQSPKRLAVAVADMTPESDEAFDEAARAEVARIIDGYVVANAADEADKKSERKVVGLLEPPLGISRAS